MKHLLMGAWCVCCKTGRIRRSSSLRAHEAADAEQGARPPGFSGREAGCDRSRLTHFALEARELPVWDVFGLPPRIFLGSEIDKDERYRHPSGITRTLSQRRRSGELSWRSAGLFAGIVCSYSSRDCLFAMVLPNI